MGFFDDMPARDEDRWESAPRRQPEWSGPPENTAGATVILDRVLANTGDAAAILRGAEAFPTGVVLRAGLARRARGDLRDSFMHFRFGVGLPDGRKLVSGAWDDGELTARLVPRGGGGGPLTWVQSYWLWPLPPEGTLQIAVEWADEGIAETVVDIDSAPLREAAARAVELWPDERPVG